MDLAVLKTLEYHKIIAQLTEQASCALGKELAENLVPSSEFLEVSQWMQETAEGKAILDLSLRAPLGGIRDIRGSLQKAELGAMLETHELLSIASTLYAMRQIKRFFKDLTLDVPILKNLAQNIEIVGQLENNIETTIDEHGHIRDTASIELQRIRREIKQSQNRIKERLDSVLRSAEYQKFFQEALVTMRDDRYVVPIKQEYRQSFPGIIHDQSSSGATLFIEPMAIVNLNNDVKQLMAAEKHELERILRVATLQVAKYAGILSDNNVILAQIDFIFAKAKLGQDMEATMPLLNQTGYVELHQAKHPLIDKAKVVPIDIVLGKEYNTLLITGPNTGGKTVSIKTLGLFALMVQSGLFIPVLADSKIAVFHNVFADIGDEQSIEQSLSTFSAHMTHLVKILAMVEAEDLLLIDEIGAGTDPEEGAALAMAILEHLMKIGTKVVATTHYSELKTFAYAQAGIENASVEFDIATLRPTYRLLIGIPGASNAFAISKRLGLADSLILRARQLIDADHAKFEQILNHLETEKLMYEQKNADIMERQQQVETLERKVHTMRAELTAKKDRMIRKAQEDSAGLIRRTRREAEQIITELKAQFNDQGTKKRQTAIDDSRQRLKDGLQAVTVEKKPAVDLKPLDYRLLKPGDYIYVTTLDQRGSILSFTEKDVFVQLGIMKMTVPLSVCRAIETQKKSTQKIKSQSMGFAKVNEVNREVDIRGMLVDEAEEIVGKYLDDALLAGLSQVLIIHGKGTGALRKGIRAYLKTQRCVQDMHFGEASEGGDGVTVVQLS